MNDSILVAFITGGLSLIGVVITCLATAKKSEMAMKVSQAVTDTKIEELTREVREHNGFAQKMPVIQQQVSALERRVSTLEKFHQQPLN